MLGLSVLAAIGLASLLRARRHAALWASVLALAALVEVTPAPMRFKPVPAPSPVYKTLAMAPEGAVVEMPFFWLSRDLHRHTYYMRMSTLHWKPLVNGYSDHFPSDFAAMALPVHWFPTREAFDVLKPYSPRYVVFHLNFYDRVSRAGVLEPNRPLPRIPAPTRLRPGPPPVQNRRLAKVTASVRWDRRLAVADIGRTGVSPVVFRFSIFGF